MMFPERVDKFLGSKFFRYILYTVSKATILNLFSDLYVQTSHFRLAFLPVSHFFTGEKEQSPRGTVALSADMPPPL